MSNILWIADYSVKQNKGGAQQTNKAMIDYGRSKGHYIKTISGEEEIPDTDKYDLIILNNITKFSKEDIEKLVATGKCLRYEHDHWVARNYPDLYTKVRKTIFLSPFHRDSIFRTIKCRFENYALVPSPIDTTIFKMSKTPKEPNSVIFVGNLCEDKGSNDIIQYAKDNPHLKFYAVGWGSAVESLKVVENIEYVGELSQKELVKYYQRCEYFYHKPKDCDAFARTVIEAYLCGCNLILNSQVGAVSWDWDFSNYNEIKKNVQSQSKFWKVIEDEIQVSRDI